MLKRRGAAIALVLPLLAAAPGARPLEVSGWGGVPVSGSVTSLWLNGPKTGDRANPLILVFFRGEPGWHKRKWGIESHFGTGPAWIRVTSPDLTLSIERDEALRWKVQDRPVDPQKANVFLVSPVGGGSVESGIEALGLFTFEAPAHSHSMPAQLLLERYPDLKRAVLGEGN